MHLPTVVVGLGLLAAGLHGCSRPDADVATSTTTTAPPLASTTTTSPPDIPERAAIPDGGPLRRGRMRQRAMRVPRVTRQAIRAQLASALAARRPDRPLPPGELDQLTTRAMQIRVVRSRLARLRPTALETPRAVAMRGRLDKLLTEFQAQAGVPLTDVPGILDPPPPPPRRGGGQ
jgi:hypothetical protein